MGKAAARFISFFVNDPAAGSILGVPLFPGVRQTVEAGLNPTERKTVTYVASLRDKVSAYPPPAPIGANEFDRGVMRVAADAIAFGQVSVADGARQLVDMGKQALRGRT